jgi:hypothetical protein
VPQLHHELTMGCGEGFLGKAKNDRYEPSLPHGSQSHSPPSEYGQAFRASHSFESS